MNINSCIFTPVARRPEETNKPKSGENMQRLQSICDSLQWPARGATGKNRANLAAVSWEKLFDFDFFFFFFWQLHITKIILHNTLTLIPLGYFEDLSPLGGGGGGCFGPPPPQISATNGPIDLNIDTVVKQVK